MNMPRVELIYESGCAQLVAARAAIRSALTVAGFPLMWQEWDRAESEAPSYARAYPSPTVLVAGREVTGQLVPPPDGAGRVACCAFAPPEPRQIFAALTATSY